MKRRVSFKEEGDSCSSDKETEKDIDDTDCEWIRIAFKHSEIPSRVSSDVTDEITSPSDIYSQYMRHRIPKSILKPSQSVEIEMLPVAFDNSSYDKAELIQYVEPAVKVSIINNVTRKKSFKVEVLLL